MLRRFATGAGAVMLVGALACAPDAAPGTPTAEDVFAAAQRALGGQGAVARTRFARFRANAEGPGGAYEVTVQATAEGAARLDFSQGFSGVAGAGGGWIRNGPGEATAALTDTLETFVRGHDLMMTAFHPETRYGPFRLVGETEFDGDPAIRVDGVDALGAPIELYYAATDTVPLGFRIVDHLRGRGPVMTRLLDWEMTGALRVPTAARFVQGDEIFVYDIVEIEVSDVAPATVFDPESPDR